MQNLEPVVMAFMYDCCKPRLLTESTNSSRTPEREAERGKVGERQFDWVARVVCQAKWLAVAVRSSAGWQMKLADGPPLCGCQFASQQQQQQ